MVRICKIFLALTFLSIYSCKPEPRHTIAIKDFRDKLQPYLINIVSKAVVMPYDSALHHIASDNELRQLSSSEHPVLRASANNEILDRKSFDHYDYLMNHLDDTAIVAVDAGEFGLWYRTVSDNLIDGYLWTDKVKLDKSIDKIITAHNYLRAAFIILLSLEAQEKYYPYIKDMAMRERKSVGYYEGDNWTPDIDLALYGLAKFKKKEDVHFIKNSLLKHAGFLNEVSFKTMKEFPDTAYMEVFEKYYKHSFYRNISLRSNVNDAKDFIKAVASYKNIRAEKILREMLHKKPFINEFVNDIFGLKHILIEAIWNNPYDTYSDLRKEITPYMLKYEMENIVIPYDYKMPPSDSTKFEYRWFRQ